MGKVQGGFLSCAQPLAMERNRSSAFDEGNHAGLAEHVSAKQASNVANKP